jgi:hypothetical protein
MTETKLRPICYLCNEDKDLYNDRVKHHEDEED